MEADQLIPTWQQQAGQMQDELAGIEALYGRFLTVAQARAFCSVMLLNVGTDLSLSFTDAVGDRIDFRQCSAGITIERGAGDEVVHRERHASLSAFILAYRL